MASYQQICQQLPSTRRFGPGIVGVFAGGTSGIGESTAREFVRYATSPRVYLVGRSQQEAMRIQDELQQINADSDVRFVPTDLSLLCNVDKVCREIKAHEHKINLLCMSAGIFHYRGREETSEGLDRKLSLDFYSRLRFAENLMPELRQAAAGSESHSPLASVITVLGGGSESSIDVSNLSLKRDYTTSLSVKHAVTMTTLCLERLATSLENGGISFFHTSPGMVYTNSHRDLGTVFKSLVVAFSWAFNFLTTPVRECGERHLWIATSGVFGRGFHLVGKRCEKVDNGKVLRQLQRDGTYDAVWKHTREVYREICSNAGS